MIIKLKRYEDRAKRIRFWLKEQLNAFEKMPADQRGLCISHFAEYRASLLSTHKTAEAVPLSEVKKLLAFYSKLSPITAQRSEAEKWACNMMFIYLHAAQKLTPSMTKSFWEIEEFLETHSA